MARRPTGQVLERRRQRGRVYALRFRAYGERRYVTLGSSDDGWTRQRADEELENVLADVRRGIWRPSEPDPVPVEPQREPTFHEFASEWLEGRQAEGLSQRALDDYRWSLTCHLLPFFAQHKLGRITIEEVDRYRRGKVREREAGVKRVEQLEHELARAEEAGRATVAVRGALRDARRVRGLSNASINKTLKHLAAVLDLAVEYGHLPANPAKGRRRRLKADAPQRASMTALQVGELLRAAGKHRALLATAIMAGGLRVSELTGLRWRDVDLAGGWLHVAQSKTDAGVRRVDLAPHLLDELKAWKASTQHPAADDVVFPTQRGTRRDRNTVRTRILYPAIARANERLEQAGQPRIPAGVTFHSLRRTYATLMAEEGVDQRYTMRQIGHRSAALTLEVYTDVGDRKHDGNARLGERLLGGAEWAPMGTTGPDVEAAATHTAAAESAEAA